VDDGFGVAALTKPKQARRW